MKFNKKLLSLIIIIIVGIISFIECDPNNLKTSIKNVDNNKNELEKVTKVDGEVTVSFIDVGQADSILIETKESNMLIDAGNNGDGQLLVKYFKDKGIEKFDYVIGTHAHEDHIGGLDDIINNFDIGTIYMPKKVTTTKTFEDVLDAVSNKNLKISTPNIGDEFNLSEVLFKVIYLDSNASDLNDSSIVLKMIYGNNSYLFMGDASQKVEKELLDNDIKADVLKVGHHGSNYSSSLEFLTVVNPKYAIISVGENNIYNHPNEEILERLESFNIDIYRTDKVGTIKTVTDGTSIKISYEKTNTNDRG